MGKRNAMAWLVLKQRGLAAEATAFHTARAPVGLRMSHVCETHTASQHAASMVMKAIPCKHKDLSLPIPLHFLVIIESPFNRSSLRLHPHRRAHRSFRRYVVVKAYRIVLKT